LERTCGSSKKDDRERGTTRHTYHLLPAGQRTPGRACRACPRISQVTQKQFQALIGDDQDGTRFDDLIHIANERKREAKYENLTHLEMGESTNSDKHQQ